MTDPDADARHILAAYCALEDTALTRPSRADRLLARALLDRGVTLDVAQAAFILASARRRVASESGSPHPPIRSLAYFVPVIHEVLAEPLDPGYLRYLVGRLNGPKKCGSW